MTAPKNRSRYPVSSFGPELMALLIKGTKEEVVVPCKDRRQMRALQQRIHMLRGAMGREKHPQYTTVTRARTSQTWDIGENGQPYNWRLRVYPQDAQFADIIEKAGVKVEAADSEVLLDSALPPEPSNDPDVPLETETPVIDHPTSENIYERFK